MSAPPVVSGCTLADADGYAAELRAAGLVLSDGSLLGPATRYGEGELWAYVVHLWGARRDVDRAYRNMSTPRGDFDSRRARDVVRAAAGTGTDAVFEFVRSRARGGTLS